MKFIDEAPVTLSSGHGGPGVVSFRREKYVNRGGPDGGDGGKGGDVVFRVDTRLHSLLDFKYKKIFTAPRGRPGEGANCSGAQGVDLILDVPAGTIIKDQSGKTLLDLGEKGKFVFLKGGRGGKGNTFFANSVNQAPMNCQPGEEGDTRNILLELKLIADVGIVGYPNAGKSTLISAISAARPKIADYPFTTLTPNLGVVKIDDSRTIVVADIPGLVPGAHKGVGLGTQFLRHIERTNLFVHLIDASESAGREAMQDYHDIMHELREYDKSKNLEEGFRPLLERKQIVVLNKIDAVERSRIEEMAERFRRDGIDVKTISAATGQGVRELVFEMGGMVGQTRTNEH